MIPNKGLHPCMLHGKGAIEHKQEKHKGCKQNAKNLNLKPSLT